MTKKVIQHLSLLFLLLPLLFINIKNSHDWGDDFAQYVHQSQNLITGVSQNNTGTIFNDTYFIGPTAYPIGFPLILSPVIYFFGYNIAALNIYLSLFLLLSCYLGFIFLSKHFSFLTALFTTLIIAYNPILLSLKTEILSDLPYLFFSLLSLFLIIGKENIFRSVILGSTIAISIHIRSVGFVLLLVYLVSVYFKYRKTRSFTLNLFKPQLIGLSVFLILFLVLKFGFPCDTNYPFPFEANNFWKNFNEHLTYNFENLIAFFRSYNSRSYSYIGIIAAGCLVAFGIAGFILSFKSNKFDLINYYFLLYVLAILCFKFGDAGFRFILPVLFFIFYYAIIGLSKIIENITTTKKCLPIIFGLIIILLYKAEVMRLINTTKEINEGPEKPDAKKLFEFINSNLTENDIIEFEKPRVITLYTKARSIAIKPIQTELELKSDLQKHKINYVLVHYILTDIPMKQFTQNANNNCVSVFKNNDLELFKVN